ncbi:hypothetical protein LBMAG56_35270 [Verrucomicrobiota bacterium]|nr:hypothetical protein LBMAG56_35270 [Verrucomicrobiota bacterium]
MRPGSDVALRPGTGRAPLRLWLRRAVLLSILCGVLVFLPAAVGGGETDQNIAETGKTSWGTQSFPAWTREGGGDCPAHPGMRQTQGAAAPPKAGEICGLGNLPEMPIAKTLVEAAGRSAALDRTFVKSSLEHPGYG